MPNGDNGSTSLNDDLREFLSEVEIIEAQCPQAAHQLRTLFFGLLSGTGCESMMNRSFDSVGTSLVSAEFINFPFTY